MSVSVRLKFVKDETGLRTKWVSTNRSHFIYESRTPSAPSVRRYMYGLAPDAPVFDTLAAAKAHAQAVEDRRTAVPA